jgi:tRNA (guanine-N7-)-methyltransferase
MQSQPRRALSAEPAILYDLRSILEPLELASLFPKPQPLEVELGCGDGSFLMDYARLRPERNFIGVERLLGRVRKLERKGRRLGIQNVRGVRIESSYFLRYLLPESSASAIHVYFPDPWPKRKHARHRLINDSFPGLARQALAPGGMVFLRTDSPSYFDQMSEVFAVSPHFAPTEAPAELTSVLTDFEKEFVARGITTRRATYQLRD